jgi:phosphoglycerate dehydrogenase-like enzyme
MRTLLLGFKPEALTEAQVARVREAAPEMRVILSHERDTIEQALDSIEIAAGSFPRELLPRARSLRWYQQWSAGADWLMRHPEVADMAFVLTSASGVHSVPISEHIFALLLAFARQLPQAYRSQTQKAWESPSGVFELAGKTMLLIGVGEIGKRTAVLAQAFGMHVLGVRHDPTKRVPGVDTMAGPDQLAELLPTADVVVLTVPLTKATSGLFGEREFSVMKRGAYLINIGRGGTIQEDALVRALQEGWIAGAGLDVFETEPLPEDSPLWRMNNVIITAHYSGSTPEYNERALEIFLDNLTRYRNGRALRNVVDKQAGY